MIERKWGQSKRKIIQSEYTYHDYECNRVQDTYCSKIIRHLVFRIGISPTNVALIRKNMSLRCHEMKKLWCRLWPQDDKEIPYRTKIRRTKVSKFQLGVENFVRRKFCPIF